MSSGENFPSSSENRPELKTLSSFLLSKEHSVYLSDMIEREGSDDDKALAQRFADKKLEPDDIPNLITRWQKPFKEKFEQYTAAKESLTPALIQRFGQIDSTFAEALVAMGGVDKMANVYRNGLLSLAVNHPGQFAAIRDSLLSYQKHQEVRAKAIDGARKYGFDLAKYDSILKLEDADERAKEIKSQVKSQMTGWGKFFNFVSGGMYGNKKGAKLREAMAQEHEIADAVEAALVGTAHENAEIRTAFAHEAMDRIPPIERKTLSFIELRDLNFEKEMLEAWKEDPGAKEIAVHGKTDDEIKAVREAFRDKWKADKKASLEAGGGMWAPIAVSRLVLYDPELDLLAPKKKEHRRNPNQHGGNRGGNRRGNHGRGHGGNQPGAHP